MGVGKTATGKRLAAQLGWYWIDLDRFIENRYFKNIAALFDLYGEQRFREIERLALEEVSAYEQVVISTGGGTAAFDENIALMNQKGFTIYLELPVENLIERLRKARIDRPLLHGMTVQEQAQYIRELLAKREPLYRQAQMIVPVQPSDFVHIKQILEQIEPLL